MMSFNNLNIIHLLKNIYLAVEIGYGARALNEGGIQSLPKLSFQDFVGCEAGFLNVPKIKGTHLAIKSGIIARNNFKDYEKDTELSHYNLNIKNSWLYKELYSKEIFDIF